MDITIYLNDLRTEHQTLNDIAAYRRRLTNRIQTLRKRLGISTGKKTKGASAALSNNSAQNQVDHVHLLLLQSERGWAGAREIKQNAASKRTISGASRTQITSKLAKSTKSVDALLNLLTGDGSEVARLEASAYRSLLLGTIFFEKNAWDRVTQALAESWLSYSALAQSQDSTVFRDFSSSEVEPSFRIAGYQSTQSRSLSVDKLARRAFPREKTQLIANLERLVPGILDEPKEDISSTGLKSGTDLRRSVAWRTRMVEIEDPAIAQSWTNVGQLSQTFIGSVPDPHFAQLPPPVKAERYDPLLIASQDTIDAVSYSISDLTATGLSSSDPRMQTLQVIRTATTYNLIAWRIGRNRVLVGSKDGIDVTNLANLPNKKRKQRGENIGVDSEKRPVKIDEPTRGNHSNQAPLPDQSGETSGGDNSASDSSPEHLSTHQVAGRNLQLKRLREKVALHDASIQSIDTAMTLPGVAGDNQLQRSLDTKKAYFRSLRLHSIALSHIMLGHTLEAATLLATAEAALGDVSSATLEFPDDPTPPQSGLDISLTDFHRLLAAVRQFLLYTRALKELGDLRSADVKQAKSRHKQPLVDRLNTYPNEGSIDLGNLVVYPPRVLPVPVKPVFLDVAWNYIDYPGVKTVATPSSQKPSDTETEDQEAQSKKRGWFGFGR